MRGAVTRRLARSKPSPPVACSLLICSSFCENGVVFTLMPVFFSKFGITGFGSSSSQLQQAQLAGGGEGILHDARAGGGDGAGGQRALEQHTAGEGPRRQQGFDR